MMEDAAVVRAGCLLHRFSSAAADFGAVQRNVYWVNTAVFAEGFVETSVGSLPGAVGAELAAGQLVAARTARPGLFEAGPACFPARLEYALRYSAEHVSELPD